MPRAVIDTNVVLAACYGRRAWQSPLLTAWLGGRFDWATSEALLVEFLEVAARPEQRLRIRAGVASESERLLHDPALVHSLAEHGAQIVRPFGFFASLK